MQGRATERNHVTTAGIDVAKGALDVAIEGEQAVSRFANDPAGIGRLIEDLHRAGVRRVGMEATGGYERAAYAALIEAGFETVLLQPIQVRAYAVATCRRAKTDALDARLIAACVRHIGRAGVALSRLHLRLAEHLLLIEQVEEDLARARNRLEHFSQLENRRKAAAALKALEARHKRELAFIVKALRTDQELARRLALVASIDGVGERTALTLVIRMPELGTLTREQAAALAGVAPFDIQSGQHRGQARIRGGRARVRRALFAAALPAAYRWNKALGELYTRLTAKGRSHKQALIACVRKLIIYANTVLERGSPWMPVHPNG
jgi:transposase